MHFHHLACIEYPLIYEGNCSQIKEPVYSSEGALQRERLAAEPNIIPKGTGCPVR